MPSSSAYLPILNGGGAELEALGWLDSEVKRRVVPLVELVPGELEAAARRLGDGWGGQHPILVDTIRVDPPTRLSGEHPLVALFEVCQGRVQVIPVGGLRRGIDHAAALAGVVAAQRRGAALRLEAADFGGAGGCRRQIEDWLAVVDLAPGEVDLVLDLGEVSEPSHMSALLAAHEALSSLPYAEDWRSVTLAGTAFPPPTVNGRADSEQLFARLDWRLWKMVASDEVPRSPAFGDHVVASPVSAAGMTITYTAGCSWLVVKRRRLAPRADELRAASQVVLARPEFAGAGHCRGCSFIEACAAGAQAGSPATWCSVSACHHIHANVDALAALHG